MARELYEIIWIELYERLVPEVKQRVDFVITCGQKGLYHKHKGYNVALLQARGKIVCVCDSDAIFPPDFVESIINKFRLLEIPDGIPLVLMHYQWRSASQMPGDFSNLQQIHDHQWLPLWPNVGACVSVRRRDAITFGGFDEHESFRGYMCGPYDLGWRMVNAGIREEWHDPSVAIWHFAHPDPVASFNNKFSWKLWREIACLHIDAHALTAVDAFSSGRILPLEENQAIFACRMSLRTIGTPFEEKYANLPKTDFSSSAKFQLKIKNYWMALQRSPLVGGILSLRRNAQSHSKTLRTNLGSDTFYDGLRSSDCKVAFTVDRQTDEYVPYIKQSEAVDPPLRNVYPVLKVMKWIILLFVSRKPLEAFKYLRFLTKSVKDGGVTSVDLAKALLDKNLGNFFRLDPINGLILLPIYPYVLGTTQYTLDLTNVPQSFLSDCKESSTRPGELPIADISSQVIKGLSTSEQCFFVVLPFSS